MAVQLVDVRLDDRGAVEAREAGGAVVGHADGAGLPGVEGLLQRSPLRLEHLARLGGGAVSAVRVDVARSEAAVIPRRAHDARRRMQEHGIDGVYSQLA